MNIISLFSGCGGLDLGFKRAGFHVSWANEKDQNIWETFEKNHPETFLDKRSITNVPSEDIPDCIGVIGGPPCQSWSTAGKGRGVDDPRGKLFLEFVRIINDKKPKFFVAENVQGILAPRHKESFNLILESLKSAGEGYDIFLGKLNASDYGVPQERKRVIIVGFAKNLNISFEFPRPYSNRLVVKDSIKDLASNALPSINNYSQGDACVVSNHEYWVGKFSYIFMSRNRVLNWEKPSFTIQANGRQISLHPNSPKMINVAKDVMKFENTESPNFRRLTVRECARLQTFPDDFKFYYNHVGQGYKMVGNAVPVELGFAIAESIFGSLEKINNATHIIEFTEKNTSLEVA